MEQSTAQMPHATARDLGGQAAGAARAMTVVQPVPVATIPLREVATIHSGGTPSKANASFWVGDIPWVSPKDMGEDRISDAEDHISPEAVEGSATKLVPAGSILVVVRSGILVRKLPIGLTIRPVAFNQDIKAVVVDEVRFLPEFIFWLLRAAEPRALAVGVKKGATVHSLTAGYLESLPVPVLPLDEQRRVVDILNHAASIRRLRDEARAKVREIVPAMFVDMFGDPATNPKGWEVSTLGAEIHGFEGGHSPKAGEEDASPYKILKLSAVTGGIFRPEEHKPAPNGYEPTSVQVVKQGDILVTRSNTAELVGAVALVRQPVQGLLLPDLIWRVVLKPETRVLPDYIWAFCQVPSMRRAISQLATGTSDSMRKLSQGRLRTLPIVVPSLALQQEFAERVAEVQGICALNDHAVTAAEQMAQSLLAQAFGQVA